MRVHSQDTNTESETKECDFEAYIRVIHDMQTSLTT